jgi:hypothetical protein
LEKTGLSELERNVQKSGSSRAKPSAYFLPLNAAFFLILGPAKYAQSGCSIL